MRVERYESLDTMIQTAICECSDEKCVERVSVTPEEYGFVRSKPNRFFIAPRHDQPAIERVIYRHDRYWVVEKFDSSLRHNAAARSRDDHDGALGAGRLASGRARRQIAWITGRVAGKRPFGRRGARVPSPGIRHGRRIACGRRVVAPDHNPARGLSIAPDTRSGAPRMGVSYEPPRYCEASVADR
jgi:hypothetical protein